MLASGTKIGPYEILAPLGAGGMGEVYRARDSRLSRDVAVKVLPASFAENPDRLRRFEQEARATGMLNHPNILAVYDVGSHDGAPYLVTELLEGQTLREELPVPRRKALDYARQIATGLAAAHAKGVTHRDLKPENLFVTSDGRAKILDFGLAKVEAPAVDAEPTRTAGTTPGLALGTVGYMSPEQALGKAADHRSDIFTFGAILYEMLTGARAFQAPSGIETLNAILKADPPPLADAALDRLVRRCLEKSPDQRFQSASDLAFDLETLSGASTTALKAVRAPRRAIWLAPAVLGIVAVFTAGMWLGSRRAPAVTSWTGVQLGGSNIAIGPRMSPDGKTLAFQAMVDGQSQVAVMHPGSPGWTVLTHDRTAGELDNICWSRDGTKIYFGRDSPLPTGVFSVPALGGEERLILEDANNPEILPDGSMIVMRINQARVFQFHRFWPHTARVEALSAYPYPNAQHPSAFADGKEILYYGNPTKLEPPWGFYALDLASGHSRPIVTEPKLDADTLGNSLPLATEPNGRSFLTAVRTGDVYRIVRIPRQGGSVETLLSLTSQPWSLDIDASGSLYVDQVDRPFEALRFPSSGGIPEHLGSSRRYPADALLLPGDRTLLVALLAGRERLLIARPKKDPVPFVESEEETTLPMARVGENEVAFLAGTGSERLIAIASIADGRIRRRLSNTKGIPLIAMAAAPDGKTLYYVATGNLWSISAAGESGGGLRLDGAGGEPHKIAAADGVAPSPDGHELILLRGAREGIKLSRLTIATGAELPIPYASDLRIEQLSNGAVGRDGRIVTDVCPVDSWFCPPAILDPKTGKVNRIPVAYEGDYRAVSWTSDGRIFAAASAMRSTLWRFQAEK